MEHTEHTTDRWGIILFRRKAVAAPIQSEETVGQGEESMSISELPAPVVQSSRTEQSVSSLPSIERVYRHTLLVRISHWLNVPCLFILIMSGLQIFNAHPALYWGDRSDRDQPLFSIRPVKTEAVNRKASQQSWSANSIRPASSAIRMVRAVPSLLGRQSRAPDGSRWDGSGISSLPGSS